MCIYSLFYQLYIYFQHPLSKKTCPKHDTTITMFYCILKFFYYILDQLFFAHKLFHQIKISFYRFNTKNNFIPSFIKVASVFASQCFFSKICFLDKNGFLHVILSCNLILHKLSLINRSDIFFL